MAWKGLKPEKPTPDSDDETDDHPLDYLIDWYDRVRNRTARGLTTNPILFSEIGWFLRLYRHSYDDFDIDTLEKLDAVWLNSLPKSSQPDKKG
jgi:hypothetical protein